MRVCTYCLFLVFSHAPQFASSVAEDRSCIGTETLQHSHTNTHWKCSGFLFSHMCFLRLCVVCIVSVFAAWLLLMHFYWLSKACSFLFFICETFRLYLISPNGNAFAVRLPLSATVIQINLQTHNSNFSRITVKCEAAINFAMTAAAGYLCNHCWQLSFHSDCIRLQTSSLFIGEWGCSPEHLCELHWHKLDWFSTRLCRKSSANLNCDPATVGPQHLQMVDVIIKKNTTYFKNTHVYILNHLLYNTQHFIIPALQSWICSLCRVQIAFVPAVARPAEHRGRWALIVISEERSCRVNHEKCMGFFFEYICISEPHLTWHPTAAWWRLPVSLCGCVV